MGEDNNGGDLVEINIKAVDAKIPFEVVHASRGKALRAEPISALYEQARFTISAHVHSLKTRCVNGFHRKSPDRIDAIVWVLINLLKGSFQHGHFDLSKLIRTIPRN